mgnify:CR=1 FL=1
MRIIHVLQLERKHKHRLLSELRRLLADRSQNFLFMVKTAGLEKEILMEMIHIRRKDNLQK